MEVRGVPSARLSALTFADQHLVPFNFITHNYSDIQAHLDEYLQQEDWIRWWYFQRLGATANGRYHFRQPNLNEAVNESDAVDLRPVRFRDWLERVWGPAQ